MECDRSTQERVAHPSDLSTVLVPPRQAFARLFLGPLCLGTTEGQGAYRPTYFSPTGPSDNAVQKISEPEAVSNARRNINPDWVPSIVSATRTPLQRCIADASSRRAGFLPARAGCGRAAVRFIRIPQRDVECGSSSKACKRACAILVLLSGTVDAEAMPRGALGVSRKLVVDPNEHSRVERRGLHFVSLAANAAARPMADCSSRPIEAFSIFVGASALLGWTAKTRSWP